MSAETRPPSPDEDGTSPDGGAGARIVPTLTPSTKKEERTKSPAIPQPVPDAAMYAGVLGDMVHMANPTTEADPVGVYASLLAMAGAAIGSDAYVQIGNTRHPLFVWPLLFGNTGSGRKGEATNTARTFFRNAYPATDEFMVTGLSSGEGLIERIRDPEDEEDDGGSNDKRLLVVEPEFAQVMARAKREGSTLAAVLRQAWDGGALSVLNRAHLKASGSHVAIIGHITPLEFRIKLAEADMAGGTYNRFLPFFVDRSKRLPLPSGLSAEQIAPLAQRLAQGITAAKGIHQIGLDREAIALWTAEIYEELTTYDDEAAVYTQFIQRAAPYCRRIAALSAALDGRRMVSKDDLAAASATVRYSIASAKYILGRTSRNPNLDKVRRAIGAAGSDGLTRSEISALFSRNMPKDALDTLLDEILSSGEVETFARATGGRPAVAYREVAPSEVVAA